VKALPRTRSGVLRRLEALSRRIERRDQQQQADYAERNALLRAGEQLGILQATMAEAAGVSNVMVSKAIRKARAEEAG
jgi:hypothetical protein